MASPHTETVADHLSPAKEAQILDGAALVFALDGYEGASMSRIAAEAGVSKGTLYNYFAGKAELFAAYVQRDCDRRLSAMFDDLAANEAPEETLRRIGRRMLETMLSDTGLTMYRMAIAEAQKFPELSRVFYEAGPVRAVSRMTEWIRQTAEQGKLSVEDPAFAAQQLFGLMQTELCIKRRLGIIDHASESEIGRVVDAAVGLFMKGYGS